MKWLVTIVVVGIAGLNEFWDCSKFLKSFQWIKLTSTVEYEKIRHIYSRTDVGRLPPRSAAGQKSKTA